MLVKFKKLKPAAQIPTKGTKGAACYDVYCPEELALSPGDTTIIKAGFAVKIPEGYELLIRGRSGLSSKGILVHTGVCDSDYRGEVGVIVTNLSKYTTGFKVGERIAQLRLAETPLIEWEEVDTLDETERGTNGYGSTGR